MKRIFACVMAMLLLLGCVGCGKQQAAETTAATTAAAAPTEPVAEQLAEPEIAPEEILFPKGTKIVGVEVDGLNSQQALELVNSVIAAYSLEAVVNNKRFYISAESVLLSINPEDITAYAVALNKGDANPQAPALTLDSGLLRQRIAAGTGSSVVEAKVVYNKSSHAFEVTKERSGYQVDIYTAAQTLEPAMLNMDATASVSVDVQKTEPTRKSTDPLLQNAVTKANEILSVNITYVYEPEGEQKKVQTVTKDEIGAMIAFDGAMNPYVDSKAVNDYAVKMNAKYSVRGKYQTPDGVPMDGYGPILQAVNVPALAADLKNCLEKGISGTRNAPYNARVEAENATMTDCVIVNLSAQQMSVYNKAGACVLTTPIVSGCVYNDTETITGVFSIYAKARHVTLTGPGYASPVSYWMPFSGGYGLHDANWRSVFGGEEYLFNGSHGCVNIPPSVAGIVYDNVSVGTKVVIYGGTTTVKERPQNLTAVTTYKFSDTTEPFNLNVTALGEPKLTYSSSNPKVAEVSADGTVTIKGVGTAVITVVAPAHAVTSSRPGAYLEGTLDITITVTQICVKGHTLVWKNTKEPSCTPGEMTGTCTVCGHAETKTLDPSKEHSYGKFTTTTKPGCETAGVSSATCSVCKHVTNEPIEAKGHNFGSFTTTTKPTCEAAGVATATCRSCNKTKTEPIEAKGHNFGSFTTTTKPTCEAAGVATATCRSCNKTKTEPIDPKGHNFGSFTTTTEPGCETAGVATATCRSCNKTKTQSVEPKGHSYGAFTTTTEPGCETTGIASATCSGCGKVKSQEVAVKGHSYGTFTTITEPGCETAGVESATCSGCGNVKTQEIPAKGHSHGAFTTITEPGCETAGVESATCSGCGDVKTREIPAKGHAYGDADSCINGCGTKKPLPNPTEPTQ